MSAPEEVDQEQLKVEYLKLKEEHAKLKKNYEDLKREVNFPIFKSFPILA